MNQCLHEQEDRMKNQTAISTFAILATALATGSTTVRAEVVGVAALSYYESAPVPTSWGWVNPIDLMVRCNSPDDNIIGVSNATIFLSGMEPSWYNTAPKPGGPLAGAAPLTGIDTDLMPWMIGDSFVTIGHDQDALTNSTVLEPSFDDALFLTDGSIGESTGWYNSDPGNGQGLVGDFPGLYGYVFVGRFSIVFPEKPFGGEIPMFHVTSLTITYTTGLFGSEVKTWTLTTPIHQQYYIPAPGTALSLLVVGVFGRRRKR
jgi:hypothetical protein